MIVTTDEAVEKFDEWVNSDKHIVILVKCPKTLKTLKDKGVNLPEINIGGLHYLEGKKQYLKCMYLYDDECDQLKELLQTNQITYQPLPSDTKVDIKQVLTNQVQ